jgi:hypothetical protein
MLNSAIRLRVRALVVNEKCETTICVEPAEERALVSFVPKLATKLPLEQLNKHVFRMCLGCMKNVFRVQEMPTTTLLLILELYLCLWLLCLLVWGGKAGMK